MNSLLLILVWIWSGALVLAFIAGDMYDKAVEPPTLTGYVIRLSRVSNGGPYLFGSMAPSDFDGASTVLFFDSSTHTENQVHNLRSKLKNSDYIWGRVDMAEIRVKEQAK